MRGRSSFTCASDSTIEASVSTLVRVEVERQRIAAGGRLAQPLARARHHRAQRHSGGVPGSHSYESGAS